MLASRKTLRGYRLSSPSSNMSGSGAGAGTGALGATAGWGAAAGSGAACSAVPRYSWVAARAQRKPKMTAMITPATTAVVLTISPARMQTMPTAKPIGQIVGPGPDPPSPFATSGSPASLSSRPQSLRTVAAIQAAGILTRQRRDSRRKRPARPPLALAPAAAIP